MITSTKYHLSDASERDSDEDKGSNYFSNELFYKLLHGDWKFHFSFYWWNLHQP